MASSRVLALLSALALSLSSVSASAVLPSPTLVGNDRGILRLRGGFAKTLAAAGALKEVPKLHHFSGKLSGGADSLPANIPYPSQDSSQAPKDKTSESDGSGTAGALVPVEADAAEDDEGTEVEYNWQAIHRVEPWKRAAVNTDVFDSHTKGRNMILGSAFSVPFLPFLKFSNPFGSTHNLARLSNDKGSWLNRFVRSPISPLPGLFSNRRSDPIEAMQRRPFLVIPLEPAGPMDQPHPLSRPVDKKACTGGTVQCVRTLQVENGDVLNYFELQAGGPCTYSCIGIIDALSHDPDSRDFDFQCSPAEESAMFYGHGALKWTLDTEGAVPAHALSEQSAVASASRSFRRGDRVGMLVDLAARKLVVIINGKVVLVRSHLPSSRPLR
eukprot:CAMPEP_0181298964 /NCGR_PEP_ID=MMETSP1101-20121128/6073_1 /TAXON_ID=46948 /ORGANISM="Rhodomonas abbreviata, Strain Caron Lab Isolate" /LENGTH=384 /DNA_ID=CAMNT_0023404041 /DNA_START=128 /DNA_END=1279 /DNA_ORIENTATION=+